MKWFAVMEENEILWNESKHANGINERNAGARSVSGPPKGPSEMNE